MIAAGGFVMNPEMVAEYTPKAAPRSRSCSATPTTTGSASGSACRPAAPPSTWTRCSSPPPAYPPSILLTGIIVNKHGQRFVTEDSYHSRTSGFVMDQPDSAAFLIVDEAHLERPEMPLVHVHRRLGDRRGDGSGPRHPDGKPGRHAEPVQRARRPRRGSRLSQAAGIPCATRQRTVGRVRPVAGPGDVLGLHRGRAGHHASTARCCAGTAASCPACTPRARARPTSPRTARATPAAPSSARARSSAGGPGRTRREARPGLDSGEAPFAAAEQFQPPVVVLFDACRGG